MKIGPRKGERLWEKKFDYQRVPDVSEPLLGLPEDQIETMSIPVDAQVSGNELWLCIRDGEDNVLASYDADGNETKRIELEDRIGAGFRMTDEKILVHSANGRLHVFDKDGNELWSKTFDLQMFDPAFFEDFLFVRDSENLRVLSSSTGEAPLYVSNANSGISTPRGILLDRKLFDPEADLTALAEYEDKLYEYAYELQKDVEVAPDKTTELMKVFPGEKVMLELQHRQPAYSGTLESLVRLSSLQYNIRGKDYMKSLLQAKKNSLDDIAEVFGEACPGMELKWVNDVNVFGDWDGKQICYFDTRKKTMFVRDDDFNLQWTAP
ncbi:MAG: hypothetical protein U5N86_06185 [Planctomycetota bacterium]|nr:hypothetical protein [Planctomycetota bacterium]